MATLLQITNRVLKRLREDTVTDFTEAYPNLVASFVADIAEEVNGTGPGWSQLNHTINVPISASTRVYDLSALISGGGAIDNADQALTEESVLLFDPAGRPLAWIWDDSSDTADVRPMRYLDPNNLEYRHQLDRDETQEQPVFFTVQINPEFDGWDLTIWPTPTATKHVRMVWNTPEAFLEPDTDAATSILVDNRSVRLGALYLALNERGEEIGEPGGIAEQRYNNAVASAVEREIRVRERAGYYDWARN